MSAFDLSRLGRSTWSSLKVFGTDTVNGLWAVCHHTLVLFGLAGVGAALLLTHRADLRAQLETRTLGWLQAREEARTAVVVPEFDATLRVALAEPDAISRATAADPSELNRQQAAVAYWLARRYKVAPEPVSRLVQEAWAVGKQAHLDPTLILAVMAVESSFNPFAQSPVGAQGLMQVMTRVHDNKYEAFGGQHAAFDPVTNLRVGVQVLKECIQRAGSVEGGLKFYVGAANLEADGGYGGKVLAEQSRLREVAAGRTVPIHIPMAPLAPLPPTGAGPAVVQTTVPAPAAEAAPAQPAAPSVLPAASAVPEAPAGPHLERVASAR